MLLVPTVVELVIDEAIFVYAVTRFQQVCNVKSNLQSAVRPRPIIDPINNTNVLAGFWIGTCPGKKTSLDKWPARRNAETILPTLIPRITVGPGIPSQKLQL